MNNTLLRPASLKTVGSTPETVNLHIWPRCNQHCRYCFGQFPQLPSRPTTNVDEWRRILDNLKAIGVRRVTFSGGEPTLHPRLTNLLAHARAIGLQTGIVTNGTNLDDNHFRDLDLVCMTVDANSDERLREIGRTQIFGQRYLEVVRRVASARTTHHFRLKINTVVTQLNLSEDLNSLIIDLQPLRWKILQFTTVRGENAESTGLRVSDAEFRYFVDRHARVSDLGIPVSVEDELTVQTTYAMIDPEGHVFQHSNGRHRRSLPVVGIGFAQALASVGGYDRNRFESRRGHVDQLSTELQEPPNV